MSSKRATLHRIELDKRPSPLKKKLGDVRVKDTNILGDGNYVDVELEAVDNSTNPKKRKTHATNHAESPAMICLPIDAQDYDFAEPSTSEKRKWGIARFFELLPSVASSLIVVISNHKYTGDCWAQQSAKDATKVTTSEIRSVNTGLPTQFLDVDGREYLSWYLCFLAFVLMY